MPLVLVFAQVTGISQRDGLVNTILVLALIAPIQVYLNEVFAPILTRQDNGFGIWRYIGFSCAVLSLSIWFCSHKNLSFFESCFMVMFAQANIWFSFSASRIVLGNQVRDNIKGLSSYLVGSTIPLAFFFTIFSFWILSQWQDVSEILLFGVLLTPCFQYLYVRKLYGCADVPPKASRPIPRSGSLAPSIEISYFVITVFMAFICQHWKINLSDLAFGVVVLLIYAITPFSSGVLIISKSQYFEESQFLKGKNTIWLSPFIVLLSIIFLGQTNIFSAFVFALFTQVLTFKFIADIRNQISSHGS